jgi:hypothetical protein
MAGRIRMTDVVVRIAEPLEDQALDLAAGERALRLVLECYDTRRAGQISRSDYLAHRTLQGMEGYAALASKSPAAREVVIRFFPRIYTLLAHIHQQVEDAIQTEPDHG